MKFTVEAVAGVPDVRVVEPVVHRDDRGWFFESWRAGDFARLGLGAEFVQDNQSVSRRGVLRGLHYQVEPAAQGKLVRVAAGAVYDVAVDLRRSSPTFGRWAGVDLLAERPSMLWIPPGFAHGFYTVSDTAVVVYRCTAPYSREHDRAVLWSDPDLGIDWPLAKGGEPLLSARDAAAPPLSAADLFP